jgi:hypothetical protein
MTNDFIISGKRLSYDGNDIHWNLMSGVALELENQLHESRTFTFHYQSGGTLDVTVAGNATEPFTLADERVASITVADEQGAPMPFPPFGITVKHMSKGGGGYKRFDFDVDGTARCACLNVSFHDKILCGLQADYSRTDGNTTYELILHQNRDSSQTDALISMSVTYRLDLTNPPPRSFWRVTNGALSLTPNISEATLFTTKEVRSGIWQINAADGSGHLCTTTGELLLAFATGTTALEVTQTAVSYPRL